MLSELLTRHCTGRGLRLPVAAQLTRSSVICLHVSPILYFVSQTNTLIHKNIRTPVQLFSVDELKLSLRQKENIFSCHSVKSYLLSNQVPQQVCAKRDLRNKTKLNLAGRTTSMFPHQQFGGVSHRGFSFQGAQRMPMNMNGNMIHNQQMFQQQMMGMMPLTQFVPNASFYQSSPFLKGYTPRIPPGWSRGNHPSPRPHLQHHHRPNSRDKNNLKRKSSELDSNDADYFGKMGRYQSSEPLNSSRSSFNTSTSTSMHMKLVNGAKPILHIPGQPCERITEEIVRYYNDCHQSEEDLKHKIVLSNCLYAIVRGIFPGCRLFIVGSSLSGFGTHTSDMDLCLLVTQMQDIDQKFEAVHILNAIHKSLRSCTFIKSSQVIKAKVPILKFRDSMKNIECDLNINNGVGIRNTHLLKYYCLSDTRVAPLMLFIKFWARYQNINDAHKRTISSYSLALMLLHYLQVCSPPVLPCLQKLYPERFDPSVDLKKLRLDEPLDDLSSKNTDSLGKLFQGFLNYYAFSFRTEFDVISVREGRLLSKHVVQNTRMDPAQWKCLCVEEPFDLTNTARSVFDPYIFQRVQRVFLRSAETLRKENNVAGLFIQPF